MAPDVVASVLVLQALHGLSDRQAADAVTFDLRWKAACGLAVTDTSFHATTLTHWRRRLVASTSPNRIFDAVREVIKQTGVIKGKTRRVLDSTVLDDAVATQDTVTQLVAAIRRVLRVVPGAEAVLVGRETACDYTRPGRPEIPWDDKAAKAALINALVLDALTLLNALSSTDTDTDTSILILILMRAATIPTRRGRRWRCWRCWPGRTWNGSMTAPVAGCGGSPGRSPTTG